LRPHSGVDHCRHLSWTARTVLLITTTQDVSGLEVRRGTEEPASSSWWASCRCPPPCVRPVDHGCTLARCDVGHTRRI
jgi:hypothetical protein